MKLKKEMTNDIPYENKRIHIKHWPYKVALCCQTQLWSMRSSIYKSMIIKEALVGHLNTSLYWQLTSVLSNDKEKKFDPKLPIKVTLIQNCLEKLFWSKATSNRRVGQLESVRHLRGARAWLLWARLCVASIHHVNYPRNWCDDCSVASVSIE